MAIKINWSEKAQQDRREIFTYWNARNKSTEYSKKLNILFKRRLNYLKEFPTMGRESGYEDIRYLVVRDYLIFYKIYTDSIIILRVWDGRRNPESLHGVLV